MSNDQALRNAQQEWDAQEPDDFDCEMEGYHEYRPFSQKCKHCGEERDDY